MCDLGLAVPLRRVAQPRSRPGSPGSRQRTRAHARTPRREASEASEARQARHVRSGRVGARVAGQARLGPERGTRRERTKTATMMRRVARRAAASASRAGAGPGRRGARSVRALSVYADKRGEAAKRLEELVEVQQRDVFEKWLADLAATPKRPGTGLGGGTPASLTPDMARTWLRAGFATFLLHTEARIASYLGEGFYTIGPCGEELVGVLGLLGRQNDPMALHYRHVAVQLSRQFAVRPEEDVLLDRARAYVCSSLDPVTAGHHCALGGGNCDFYVTSTLASQCPPAVGRAMGIRLAPRLLGEDKARFPSDAVSIVSLGDGSVNNAMTLSAMNLAKYAQFRGFKTPALMVITNNELCISLKGHGYLRHMLESSGMKVFQTTGAGAGHVDLNDLWKTTEDALGYVRKRARPAILLLDGITRRFGHAATDRQGNYLEAHEIEAAAAANPLEDACLQALDLGLVDSAADLEAWWKDLRGQVEDAFVRAAAEPKIETREQVLEKTQAPLASLPTASSGSNHGRSEGDAEAGRASRKRKPQPMRTHMNQIFHEALASDPAAVYIGEDVRHGGYYRVTDDLAKSFPERVQDVPPDETSVFGIGLGFTQSGLAPIVEMPYAKYLDCAADLFFEIVMSYWCSGGAQRDGMVIRLQGFDKGVFGGNFHTHNTLHLPPGLDVVCFSNGWDYVRGMRHALYQAKHAGRVIMSVDSTDLLYRRSLFSDEDAHWLREYPSADEPMLGFETVMVYTNAPGTAPTTADVSTSEDAEKVWASGTETPDLLIFSYGNGVPTSLRAAASLAATASGDKGAERPLVVDCPTLGRPTEGMRAVLERFPQIPVVFADVCKQGQQPFAGTITALQTSGHLKNRPWQCATAAPTYNPLGKTVTFLNEDDIIEAAARCCEP
ncbi:Pyruvate dehydrogenase E1 component subunit beta [Hondaea fermentalgiana]|uniref:Pyruvate dehydrogenase E1 component subunit beta n=1 Tax=Hondaea fermentalgiana TaxID=2315210 RepID=A0A2R5GAN1_9STRA|nr:Pyruvate dehydrogenase E1 component subunit beta [Hondaea fermentalgiana]|eukprot:GBG28072.1 Pyruvate dehydrogenase E1 component subunit beta [Hondaea fermentalgiana]